MIVNKNGIVYTKNFGYANSNAHIPYNTQTIENIGSVCKTFIAVAMTKAIDLGYFYLQTNINDILLFKVVNPYCPKYPITIKQLATHTSAIIDNDSIYHKSYIFLLTGSTYKDALSAIKELGYSGGLSDTTLETFLQSYLNADDKLYSSKKILQQ